MKNVEMYIVVGSAGEYDGFHSWSVCVFDDKEEAHRFADKCLTEVRGAASEWRSSAGFKQRDDIDKRDSIIAVIDAALPDQNVSVDDFDSEHVHYAVHPIPGVLT